MSSSLFTATFPFDARYRISATGARMKIPRVKTQPRLVEENFSDCTLLLTSTGGSAIADSLRLISGTYAARESFGIFRIGWRVRYTGQKYMKSLTLEEERSNRVKKVNFAKRVRAAAIGIFRVCGAMFIANITSRRDINATRREQAAYTEKKIY